MGEDRIGADKGHFNLVQPSIGNTFARAAVEVFLAREGVDAVPVKTADEAIELLASSTMQLDGQEVERQRPVGLAK